MEYKKNHFVLGLLIATTIVASVGALTTVVPSPVKAETQATTQTSTVVASGTYTDPQFKNHEFDYQLTSDGTLTITNGKFEVPAIPLDYGFRTVPIADELKSGTKAIDPDKVTKIVFGDNNVASGNLSNLLAGFKNVTSIDVSKLNVADAVRMDSLFYNDGKLATINLTGWKPTKCVDMNGMFDSTAITSVTGLDNLVKSNVIDIGAIFRGIESANKLATTKLINNAIKKWDVSNVANYEWAFDTSSLLYVDFSSFQMSGKAQPENYSNTTIPYSTAGLLGIFKDVPVITLGSSTKLFDPKNAFVASVLPAPKSGDFNVDINGKLVSLTVDGSRDWQAVGKGTVLNPSGPKYTNLQIKDMYALDPAKAPALNTLVWAHKAYVNPDSGGNGGSSTTPTTTVNSNPVQTPTTTPVAPTLPAPKEPTQIQMPNYAVKKDMAIYATRGIYMYRTPNLLKSQRIAKYPMKARTSRPMFTVIDYARSSNGTLRYKVRDDNHHAKTYGKVGYITANTKFVGQLYYQTMPKSKEITVIAKKGLNAYRNEELTGKIKHYKKSTHLRLKKLVHSDLTTRYELTSGSYVSGNKKLVIQRNR